MKIIKKFFWFTLALILSGTSFGLSEIYYDDGDFEGGSTYDVGQGYAVKFTPPIYPFKLTKITYYLFNYPNRTFEVHVWDSNGSGGKPGNDLIAPFNTTPSLETPHWHEVSLPSNYTINSGDFYVGLIFLYPSEPGIGTDTSDPNNRSYRYNGIVWDLESSNDYGIRALGYYNTTSFKIELKEGWNLVSFPLNL